MKELDAAQGVIHYGQKRILILIFRVFHQHVEIIRNIIQYQEDVLEGQHVILG